MRPIRTFHVRPALPERLAALDELAHNLRWSWDHETISLFRRLDRDLWEETGHNPVLMLGTISQSRLVEASQDEAFIAHLDRCANSLSEYMTGRGSWYGKLHGPAARPSIAYFSMEFGITECLPIYSGGLGILAGDHLKSASELGIPLVGIGLLYQKGYFRQYLSPEGWQEERYPVNDFSTMPLRPLRDDAGKTVRISVDIAGRTVVARLWRAQVGRVLLVLLDTNIPDNPQQETQDITDELYGGDQFRRLEQEMLLGIGGMRALDALGLRARVYHMNEGHSAFAGLERIRMFMKERKLTFSEALEVTRASTIFTTHTPVQAGIDVFPVNLIEPPFQSYATEVGLSREAFLDLGRMRPGDAGEPFSMAVLAIRTASYVNGVSRLHAEVSRRIWSDLWPGTPAEEVPITHITNGVHPGSWISDDMRELYDRYLGPRWSEEPGDTGVWRRGDQIPGEELWRTHERRRERLVAFARHRFAAQTRRLQASPAEIAAASEILDPAALTIGFARRFATYKRATLLLSDPVRLANILNAEGRPVQIIYAGKAHPRDDQGKALIRDVVQLARRPEFNHRIVFLEDYDTITSRYLVQGVDVWLNTPLRPQEASGTSGMKAAMNGVLNLSIRDGWWDEAWSPRAGWAIGRGEEYNDLDHQNRIEAGTLYDLLEHEVVPLFYERGSDRLPRGWIELMKSAMGELCPVFNTNRMVSQYFTEAYAPALERRTRLEAEDFQRAKNLAAWLGKVRRAWNSVEVVAVEARLPEDIRVDAEIPISVRLRTGTLKPEDLSVQLCFGTVDSDQNITAAETLPMTYVSDQGGDGLLFQTKVICRRSGMQGFTVRVLPRHEDLANPHATGLILWARG
jgi:starch phosphorylase